MVQVQVYFFPENIPKGRNRDPDVAIGKVLHREKVQAFMPLTTARFLKLNPPKHKRVPAHKRKLVAMPVIKNNSLALKFAKYWLPVISYAILIFYISSIPGENIPPLFLEQDMVFHIIEYAFFALLISRALKEYYPNQRRVKRFLWVFVVAIIYALSDEFHQSFVSHRTSSAFDVVIDGIGVFFASIFYR